MNLDSNVYEYEVDKVDNAGWMDILRRFDDASIYQTWPYGEIRRGRQNLSHLVLKRDAKVVAACQCWLVKFPLPGAGIAHIKWGPLWRLKDNKNSIDVLRQMVRSLKDEYAARRGYFLRIILNELYDHPPEVYSVFEEEGLLHNEAAPLYRTLVMNLSLPMEDLLMSCKNEWRRRLRLGTENNLLFKMGTDDSLFDTTIQLYDEMRARKHFPDFVKVQELKEIQKDLPEDFKMMIAVCEHQGKPVAAALFSFIGNTAGGLVSATDKNSLKLNCAHFMFWNTFQWLKDKGCIWCDLGGINPEGNPKTYEFKKAMSGKLGKDITFKQYEFCSNNKSLFFVKVGDYLRNKWRSAVMATLNFKSGRLHG